MVSVCLQEMRDRAERYGVASLTWQEFKDGGRRLGAFSHGKPVSYMRPCDLNAQKAHLKPGLHRACGCGLQHGEQRDTSRPGGDRQVHLPARPAGHSRALSGVCSLGFDWRLDWAHPLQGASQGPVQADRRPPGSDRAPGKQPGPPGLCGLQAVRTGRPCQGQSTTSFIA